MNGLTIRHGLEYGALRVLLCLIDSLPPAASGWLIRRAADLWYGLDGSRRRVAIENIQRSGVAAGPRTAKTLARESFRHFGMVVLESLTSARVFNCENWREKVQIDLPPETEALLNDPNRGMIVVSGHLGNWEIAAQLVSHWKPVVGVTRPMNNPYVERLVQRRKPQNNFRLTPKHDANALRFLGDLKRGDILALLIDQHAGRHGVQIDFFGSPASTHTTPAMLHLVTKAPLVFGVCIRTGPMSYRFKASEPIVHPPTGDRESDVRAIMDRINDLLERAIREHPGQYLWGHRRWRE